MMVLEKQPHSSEFSQIEPIKLADSSPRYLGLQQYLDTPTLSQESRCPFWENEYPARTVKTGLGLSGASNVFKCSPS